MKGGVVIEFIKNRKSSPMNKEKEDVTIEEPEVEEKEEKSPSASLLESMEEDETEDSPKQPVLMIGDEELTGKELVEYVMENKDKLMQE